MPSDRFLHKLPHLCQAKLWKKYYLAQFRDSGVIMLMQKIPICIKMYKNDMNASNLSLYPPDLPRYLVHSRCKKQKPQIIRQTLLTS